MIEAKELRIKNWVIWNEDETFMQIGPTSFLLPEERFNPIHLTPEILVKCGFEKDEWNWFMLENETMFSIGFGNELFISINDDEYVQSYYDYKYLHQLQNLYFSLTGEELNIQL